MLNCQTCDRKESEPNGSKTQVTALLVAMRDRSYFSIGGEKISAIDHQNTTSRSLSSFSSSVPIAPLRLKNKSRSQMKELDLLTPNCRLSFNLFD
ncbi:hypothetical protein [Microcoleus sp. herbarium14]|uniref:hypothetical protein n=1 Tax=Microcoleus sp. herbarium14 TaxID=3055439 RepID=UPI002FD5C56B